MPTSHWLAKKLLQTVLCGSSTTNPQPQYVQPPITYVALFTSPPSQDGINPGIEVVGGTTGYKRQSSSWGNVTGNSISNANRITFNTAQADWGKISYWVLFDAEVGGNMLHIGSITNSRDILAGDPPATFDTGALVITCN
jgi:hypothetical protein